MKTKTKLALIIIVILALVTVATVSAQEGFTITEETPTPTPELTACPGENVSGIVVAVDENTGTVTIDTGTGLCTVQLGDVSGGHPIAVLLGQFFGNVSAEDLTAALEATQVCVVQDEESGAWMLDTTCDAAGSTEAQLIRDNGDGTFTVWVNGEEQTISVEDPDLAAAFGDALQNAMVDWNLDGTGNLLQTSDEIEAYHEDGMGFGVLTKLYAMAAESQEECQSESAGAGEQTQASQPTEEPACGVTVQELVDLFKSGTGMGQLFKEYGKPALLGVGHVRKAAADMANGEDTGETPTFTKSNGLGRGHGNSSMTPPGLAKKNQDTGTETTVQSPSTSDSHPGNGKGPSKDNPGKGNGKSKNKGKP